MGPAPRAPHRGDVPGGGPQRRPRPRGPGRVDRRHRPDRHREGRGLVCYSLDRLAREITVQEAILAKVWEEAGGQVFTTDHGEVQRDDPDDPMRTAMRKMAGVMYELDRRLVVAWIGPEHLLDALVHPDCPGAARAVLASLGNTAERLQQARDRSFIDPFEPGSGWKKVNPAFQLVLERANLEAVLLADAEVTSEHVLLALASQWAADATATAPPPRGDLDPAGVRRRVLDVTEGVAVPPPAGSEPPPDPEEGMGRVAPGLELAPTPDGKDSRRRMPWGSRIFVDADGTPIKRTDGLALRQYFVDRDGSPVLTSDGQPVHGVFDEHGREVLAEDGRPRVVPVEIPEGSRLESHPRST